MRRYQRTCERTKRADGEVPTAAPSPPLRLAVVKNTTNDGVFYNQQYGKKHTFTIGVSIVSDDDSNDDHNETNAVRRSARLNAKSLPRPILSAELVYADTLKPAPSEIFKVYDAQDFSPTRSVATFSCRINDVSRNHRNRSFRVKISADSLKPVFSAPIMVKSKRTRSKKSKKKRVRTCVEKENGEEAFDTTLLKKQRCNSEDWSADAAEMLRKLQWQVVGYERSVVCSGTTASSSVDMKRPIVQCPHCRSVFRYGQARRHKPSCAIKYLLEDARQTSTRARPTRISSCNRYRRRGTGTTVMMRRPRLRIFSIPRISSS